MERGERSTNLFTIQKMASIQVKGGNRLKGEIVPQGAKNEVLQILCAVLLTAEPITVHNIPNI